VIPDEKHEVFAGRQAALQGGPVGCTLRQPGGLHIKLGCRNGQAGGVPFIADRLFVQPASLPFCAARRPALLSSVQPAENSCFSFENTALQLVLSPKL